MLIRVPPLVTTISSYTSGKVCITLRPQITTTESELKSYCQKNLPAFMVPDYFQFMEELPKNATGKILKTELK